MITLNVLERMPGREDDSKLADCYRPAIGWENRRLASDFQVMWQERETTPTGCRKRMEDSYKLASKIARKENS